MRAVQSSYGVAWLSQLLLVTAISAFSVLHPSIGRASYCRPSSMITFAKSSPAKLFDLEAIESFEKELRKQEAELKATLEGESLDDEEDIDDNDEDVTEELLFLDPTAEVRTHMVPDDLHNKRIDAVLSALEPLHSRSMWGNLVEEGRVQVDGQVQDRKSTKLQAGQMLNVLVPPSTEDEPTELIPENLPLSILFEDEHMIVLNKAAHMVVHPAPGHSTGTVVNALAHYLAHDSPYGRGDFVVGEGQLDAARAEGIAVDGTDGEAVSFRPGIVHRLDKGTTGVLVVAKTRQALAALSSAFKERQVKKTYLAVTVGNPGKRVVIDKPIGRHPVHRQRMRVVPDPHSNQNRGGVGANTRFTKAMLLEAKSPEKKKEGRRALSFVDTLSFDGKLSIVIVRIETGRTHQIRVHLQDRSTPVYGDDIYGFGDWNKKLQKTHTIQRPLLHAYTLELEHPITGEPMRFRAPLADDMKRIARAVWPTGPEERPDLFE